MASSSHERSRPIVWNPDKRTAPQPPQDNSGTITGSGVSTAVTTGGAINSSLRVDIVQEDPGRRHVHYQSNFVDNRNWVHNSRNLHSCINMDQNNEDSDSCAPAIGNYNSNLHESVGQTSGTPSQSNITANNISSAERHEVVGEMNVGTDPSVHIDTSQQAVNNENMAPGHSIQTQDIDIGVTATRQEMRHEPLPDLLHSHVIPSHSSSPPWQTGQSHPGVQESRGYSHHPHHHRHHSRHHHRSGHRSHHGRRRHRSRSSSSTEPEPCKEGCLSCLAASTSFRWILVILSLLGVCCVVTGIVLAALHATGNSFLFLAIMFIGLGVLLVVVVAVGWKCTPRGHEPLHALFGLGDFRHHHEQRSRSRRHGRSSRTREHQWHGGMMYPEFQYRRPPPSYNASMQDFQHQLALAQSQREQFHATEELPAEDYSLPSSPPPSYRSRASTVRTGIQITFPPNQGDNSRPPTYRSHASTQGHAAHQRPSLPEDYIQQGSDIAFTGQYNSQQHSRNSSAGNFRIHSRDNSSTDRNGVSTVVEPQGGGTVAVSVSVVQSSSQDQLLDSAVQQTLQTLDAVTGEDNLAQEVSEDEYPMETPL